MPSVDKTTFESLLYLFGLALPLSILCWALIFPAVGFLTDPDDQPIVFRFAARLGPLPAGRAARLIVAAGGLAFANSVPILYLVRPAPGTPTGVYLLYFLVQGLWLATVVRDILRARSRD
jgi:hypothetical protein